MQVELSPLADASMIGVCSDNFKITTRRISLTYREFQVIAQGHHVELCRLLIRGGADRDADFSSIEVRSASV